MLTQTPPAFTVTLTPDWLATPALQAVLAALGHAQARIAGGAVRNAVLNLPVADVDIATTHTPDQVTAILQNANCKVIPTGIDHGTVTAVLDGKHYEITTLRRDVMTDGRHAVVAFTDDWAVDAARRDFTMNALYMDADGHVYDPTGSGVQDAKNGVVKFVGDAEKRIAEDYLRILRFFRFYAFYGQGDIDKQGLVACKKHADGIKNLSGERITSEVLKLLKAPRVLTAIKLMCNNKIIEQYIDNDNNFESLLNAQTATLTESDYAARLWCVGGVKAYNLKLSNNIKKQLQTFEKFLINNDIDIKNHHALLYRYGLDMARAILGLQYDGVARQAILHVQVPVFPLRAADVAVTPGPVLGKILRATENWWLQQDCQPDHNACLAYAKTLQDVA